MTAPPSAVLNLEVFADYFQFLLEDGRLSGDLAEVWNERATADRIAVGRGVVGVQTARNYLVPVTVELRDSEPQENWDLWDHIAECSLEVPSGQLIIYGPTEFPEEAPRLLLRPGTYRARIYYGGLDSVANNGLDGDDHYRVVLWPGLVGPTKLLKRKSGTE